MGLSYKRGFPYLGRKRRNPSNIIYLALFVAVGAIFCAFLAPGSSRIAHAPVSAPEAVPEQAPQSVVAPAPGQTRVDITVNQGDTLPGILKENGVSLRQAKDIQATVEELCDLSELTPGNRLTLLFDRENQNLLGVEYDISGSDKLLVNVENGVIEARTERIDQVVDPLIAGTMKMMDLTVRKGDSIFNLLKGCGIEASQINALFTSARDTYNLADISPGHPLKIWVKGEAPDTLARLTYDIDPGRYLEVSPQGDAFTAQTHERATEVTFERAHGTVRGSLYESAVQAGVQPEIVMELTDIFGWDINFFTDLHNGDTYTVLYERYAIEGEPGGCGRVLAARFVIQGREHLAVHYDNGKGIKGYYDEHGKPIRKLFLKAPLNYRRISSGFSLSRIHPIFHVRRPHLGVDYAAPSGTPVVALGEGRVTVCGWVRGYGKTISIRHPAGYVTHYGHLSRFAKGIGKGRKVSQGEVIGYVGATGYATGPHLDFRVQHKGRFVNPLRLKPVNGPALGGKALAGFRQESLKRLTMLDDQTLDRPLRVSAVQ
jgi:murein DD-endopeptidase MepM/ murein hydrolase activator NlpD